MIFSEVIHPVPAESNILKAAWSPSFKMNGISANSKNIPLLKIRMQWQKIKQKMVEGLQYRRRSPFRVLTSLVPYRAASVVVSMPVPPPGL